MKFDPKEAEKPQNAGRLRSSWGVEKTKPVVVRTASRGENSSMLCAEGTRNFCPAGSLEDRKYNVKGGKGWEFNDYKIFILNGWVLQFGKAIKRWADFSNGRGIPETSLCLIRFAWKYPIAGFQSASRDRKSYWKENFLPTLVSAKANPCGNRENMIDASTQKRFSPIMLPIPGSDTTALAHSKSHSI